MNKVAEKAIYFLVVIFLMSCGTNNISNPGSEVNTKPNRAYKKSRTNYSGKLTETEHTQLRKRLELELKTTIPKTKSILINFNQKAPNCLSVGYNQKDNEQVTQNRIRISSRISANNNAIDYFVYTSDAPNREIYEKTENFLLDSGFFYNEVFTEHENCAGFLIVKPNGTFYKFYGEDYYSDVRAILESE